ncbi:MAG: NAD(P)-dependent oxidoreductase [Burkholderiaceae bacterium]|nr:NAD(P)-dependent oxidoreductase [Burkholderiaceae bacterium]
MRDAVLVTGGLGLVGSHVSRALVDAGYTPLIYDLRADTAMVPDIAGRCTIVQGALDDMPRLLGTMALHKPAAILHFAAQVGKVVETNPWSSLHTNLMGTVTVFEAARLSGIRRVVFASSKMAYGPVDESHRHPNYLPVTEEHALRPQDLYSKMKRSAEDIAAHYAPLHGLDIAALRFGSSFGPGGAGRHKVILMQLIEAAIAGQPFHVDAGAEQADHFCYSAEAAHAAVAALSPAVQPGRFRAYNIAGDELLSMADIVAVLKELHPGWQGSVGPGLDYRGMGTGFYYAMDTTRAREELGWRPKFDFRSAVRDYARLMSIIR